MSLDLGLTKKSAAATGLVLAVMFSGCGGDPKTAPPPPSGLSVAFGSPSGDGQFGLVQDALPAPIRVVVLRDGVPEAGASVAWTGTGTGESFNPATSITDTTGMAQTIWTLPQEAGIQSAQASVSGATSAAFTATGVPGAPTNLALVSGNAQAGGLGLPSDDPLVVRVTDQYGNGVSGVDVTWVVTQGFASVPTVTQSQTDGRAEAPVVYGQLSGPITITAGASGLGSVQFQLIAGHLITVTNNQFAPSQLNISLGNAYVVWKWSQDARNHNVVPDLIAPTRSGNPTDGPHTYVFQFTARANYAFYCEVHGSPGGTGMSGLISVN